MGVAKTTLKIDLSENSGLALLRESPFLDNVRRPVRDDNHRSVFHFFFIFIFLFSNFSDKKEKKTSPEINRRVVVSCCPS